jgi:hypothetical protein
VAIVTHYAGRWNVECTLQRVAGPSRIGVDAGGAAGPWSGRRREEWIGIPVPALIGPDAYRRTQAQVERTATLACRTNTRHSYLLRCLLTCRTCGLRMFGITPTSPPGRSIPRSYRCNGKDCTGSARERRCPQKVTPADSLEEAVWGHVRQLLSDPEALLAQFRDMARHADGGDSSQQAEADKLQDQLRRLDRGDVAVRRATGLSGARTIGRTNGATGMNAPARRPRFVRIRRLCRIYPPAAGWRVTSPPTGSDRRPNLTF